MFGEGAGLVKSHGGIQGGLASEGWEEGVRLFLGENLFHDFRGDGFDIGAVGKLGIGHNRGRIAVYEDDLIALFAEGFACLNARVVEFAGLANDDGAGADDQDGF